MATHCGVDMIVRLLAGAGAGLCLILSAGVAAQAAPDKTVAACLKSETDAKRDAHGCIGRAADACTSTPEGQSTPGEVNCAMEETNAWDALLNKEYGQLLSLLKPEAAEDLRKAQRIWITSRDADCRVPYYFYDGGSIVQILGARCVLDRTGERALLIRSWRQMAQGEDAPEAAQ